MTSTKVVCMVSLATFLAVMTGLMVGSEVRADESGEQVGSADADSLERAQAFVGEYKFVGGDEEREGVRRGIETAVDALNPVIRKIARKRLTDTNPVPKRARVTMNGDEIELRFDRDGYRARLGASPRKTTSNYGSETMKISYEVDGKGRLVELIDGRNGDRHNRVTLSADGNKMTVEVKVTSAQLPVPVEYRLTFRRE